MARQGAGSLNCTGGAGSATESRFDHQRNGRSRVGARPSLRGKFLFLGDRKLYVRGVTYGTFRPNQDGDFPDP
jgi:hypothetical protein